MALYSSNHVGGLSSHAFCPGYVFAPTEIELLGHFLLLKTQNPSIQFDEIHDPGNIYESAPDTLTVLYARKRAKAWCFFSKRIKKYEKGLRPSRTVEDKHGCWKATGGEKKLKDKNGNLLGKKQTLTYNEGKKNSIKTNWIMQEFILTSDDKKFDDFALYKIYQRNTKIKATATSFQEGMGLTDNLPLQLPYNFPSLGTQQLGNDNHNQTEFNMPIMADTRSEFYHNSNININPPGQFDDINYSYPPPLSSSIAMFNDSTLISHQQAMTALLSPFEQAMAPFTNQEIGYI